MARHNNVTRKEEPPDKGKSSQKDNAMTSTKSSLRATKLNLNKAPSPKPLKKDRYDKYTVQSFLKSPIVTHSDKTTKGPIPKMLKEV